jgi:sporulation protein YlmC with PRC-barrel domain
MLRYALAILAGSAAAGVSLAAGAAQTAVAPDMHSGFTNAPPVQGPTAPPAKPAVSPTANQITAKNVIGADIKDASGVKIATITDIILDRRDGRAAVAIIAPSGAKPFDNGAKSAVAWSSLVFEPRPIPHFISKLDLTALQAGAALVKRAKDSQAYYDVKNDLLGKTAVGPGGQPIGRISNLVLTFGSGRVVALVIDTGGFINVGGSHDHAVAWDAADPHGGRSNEPIQVAVTKAQVEQAPVTTTMAPAPIPPGPNNHNVEVKRDATGNVSGTKIPAPQIRR